MRNSISTVVVTRISHFGSRLSDATLFLCKILLVVEVTITGLGVFYRYVLGAPLPWSEEIARFVLIWMALLGASVVTQRKEQLRLDSIYDRFPETMRTVVDVVFSVVIVTVMLLLLPPAWGQITGRALANRAPATQVPMVIPQSSLLVGFVLLIVQTVINFVEDLHKLVKLIQGGSNTQ